MRGQQPAGPLTTAQRRLLKVAPGITRRYGRVWKASPSEYRLLLLADLSHYHVDFTRRGRLGADQEGRETAETKLARAQSGQAFSWWTQMPPAERLALIERLREQPAPWDTKREVQAKKKPPTAAGGSAT